MIDSNYMTNSEKLTSFLDAELDPASAESMFFDVAASPELQEEMRRQIILTKSMKNSLLVPPVALKENILATIGLSNASPTPILVPAASFFSRMMGSKLVMVLSSAAIASIITAVFMINYIGEPLPQTANLANGNALGKSAKLQASASIAPNAASYNLPNSANIPIVESSEIASAKISKSKTTASAFNSMQIAKNNNSMINAPQNDDLASAENNINDNNQANMFEITNSPGYQHSPNSVISSKYGSRRFDEVDFSNALTEFLDKVSLQLRFSNAKSFTNVDIDPINTPLLNNFALSVLYDLSPNHSVGVELGQENLLQEFSGKENDIDVTWQQNYIAFWAGMAYQYSMNEYSAIQPYFRVLLGGTRIGPLAKATLGAKLNLTSKMSTFIGWENTGLFYSYQSNVFSSYKSGVTAGVSLKF